MIRLVDATPAHVGRIANRMREMDRVECAAFGRTPKQALRLSLLCSVEAVTAFVDDRPEAMFGLTPVNALEGVGRPWFLGTARVFDCARSLISVGPELIARMHARFRTLENLVASDNTQAIRMLRHWGFEVGDDAVTIRDVEFLPFRKTA